MSGTAGNIREQIGRIEAKLDAQDERMADRQREGAEERERIWMEMRSIKHEARGGAQVLSLRLERLEKFAATAGRQHTELSHDVAGLRVDLGGLREPVADLISFNRRLSAIGIALLSVGGVLYAARETVWSALVFVLRAITH